MSRRMLRNGIRIMVLPPERQRDHSLRLIRVFLSAFWLGCRSIVSMANGTSLGIGDTPFSHLATVFERTPKISDSSTWVRLSALRRRFSSFPFINAHHTSRRSKKGKCLKSSLLRELYIKYRI